MREILFTGKILKIHSNELAWKAKAGLCRSGDHDPSVLQSNQIQCSQSHHPTSITYLLYFNTFIKFAACSIVTQPQLLNQPASTPKKHENLLWWFKSKNQKSQITTYQVGMNGSLLNILGDTSDKAISVFKVSVEIGLVKNGTWSCLYAWLFICNFEYKYKSEES